ncbi:hypothetical protein B0H19DRAFT_1272902 [Mycena capillaripes]|nr:hypothetical protein B0H19DRAFT_1272902 [Mycena capillaripes]
MDELLDAVGFGAVGSIINAFAWWVPSDFKFGVLRVAVKKDRLTLQDTSSVFSMTAGHLKDIGAVLFSAQTAPTVDMTSAT